MISWWNNILVTSCYILFEWFTIGLLVVPDWKNLYILCSWKLESKITNYCKMVFIYQIYFDFLNCILNTKTQQFPVAAWGFTDTAIRPNDVDQNFYQLKAATGLWVGFSQVFSMYTLNSLYDVVPIGLLLNWYLQK